MCKKVNCSSRELQYAVDLMKEITSCASAGTLSGRILTDRAATDTDRLRDFVAD